MIVFETERLQIREMTIEDAAFIFELVNTPEWYKFIGDRGVNSIEGAKKYIANRYLESYKTYGYGAYIMVRKSDEIVIGSCGLYKRDDLEHPDIGFAVLSRYAKQGYAFEAADALMRYAKTTLHLKTILAITIEENANSIALLKKVGLRQIDKIRIKGDDEELLLFSN